MTAWFLIGIYFHSAPILSGIATEQECKRIGDMLAREHWIAGSAPNTYKCIEYEIATERGTLQFRKGRP